MATKFIAITFFFSLAVIQPVHLHYPDTHRKRGASDNSTNENSTSHFQMYPKPTFLNDAGLRVSKEPDLVPAATGFLWMYLVFVYLFTGLALYLIVTETQRIIRIRQEYLGNQSTVTDRTIRLSGIPPELRSEEKIKETIEKLEIGKVDSVMLCRDWKELDGLIEKRMNVLRKLEEAWTVHLANKPGLNSRNHARFQPLESARHVDDDDVEASLLGNENNEQGDNHSRTQNRPSMRIWYGFLSLQSRKVDAIDYYEEKLRKLDEQIKSARKKDYTPTPLAFVTLDSTAACVSSTSAHEIYATNVYSKWLFKQLWIQNP